MLFSDRYRNHASHSRSCDTGNFRFQQWLIACLLYCGLWSTAHAEDIEVFNFDFETDPPNFVISLQTTGDATGSLEYGDIGGSRGMIYKGTFQTKPGVTEFEFANGLYSPMPPTFDDFHLYPAETDGIYSISVFIDTIVDGLPTDNENSLGGMGFFFQLWQVKDGLWDVYELLQEFSNKDWDEISFVDLKAEDFMRQDGTMPDFSPTAQPISFGFAIGIGYRWLSGDQGQFISTSARVDNWKVIADVGQTTFEDGFEKPEVPQSALTTTSQASCDDTHCVEASLGSLLMDNINTAPPVR